MSISFPKSRAATTKNQTATGFRKENIHTTQITTKNQQLLDSLNRAANPLSRKQLPQLWP